MDTSRVLIAIVLSLGLVFAYQELVLKRMYPPHPEHEARVTGPPSQTATPGAKPGAPAVAGAPGVRTLAPAPSAAPERLVEVNTDLFKAVFTSDGARLKSFELNKYRKTAAPNSPPYEMIRPASGGIFPLAAVIQTDGHQVSDRGVAYATDAPATIDLKGSDRATITFTAQTGGGLRLVKTFVVSGSSYVIDMTVSASGSAAPIKAVGVSMTQPMIERAGGYYDIPEVQADVASKVVADPEAALKKGFQAMTGQITYAGFGDRYFLAVFLPETPASGVLSSRLSGNDATAELRFPGASQFRTRVFMGPKALEVLDAVNPNLHESINFGWFGFLSLPFLRVLKLFHDFTPNWGWDIILLTLAVRMLMLPMSIKGMRSMMKMQRLSPQMEKIRAQFKEEPERMQREMVDLYKRNHVNPLGGCAPMLIQFPIFIGLYEALLNAVELRHAPFIWWIRDLSAPDCYPVSWMPRIPYMHCHGIPVLVLLMGTSTFLQQWMTPTSPDPNQQKMMMLMPVVFTVILVNFPAGLSLYYFASNILGIIQQIFLNREFRQTAPAT